IRTAMLPPRVHRQAYHSEGLGPARRRFRRRLRGMAAAGRGLHNLMFAVTLLFEQADGEQGYLFSALAGSVYFSRSISAHSRNRSGRLRSRPIADGIGGTARA